MGCSTSDAAVTPITEAEVRDFAARWFDAVSAKLPIEQQRSFFAPGVKIEIWDGGALSLAEQIALHDDLMEEDHSIRELKVEPLADGRVRATVDLRWEATRPAGQSGEQRIRADLDEEWIIDRGPDGRPRYARYLARAMRYLPGSAKLGLG
jgi:hypothetical protein